MGQKTLKYLLFKGLRHLLLFLFPVVALAQNGSWEMGVSGGISSYFGDIAPQTGISLQPAKGIYGVFLKKELTPFLSLKTSFHKTQLTGDDYLFPDQASRIGRGFFFNTSVIEIALIPEWEPFRKNNEQRFSPVIFLGPALFIIDPDANFDRNKIDGNKEGIIIDQAKNYPRVFFGLTGGLGLNFRVSQHIDLNTSAGLRVPFTDYLDGISHAANPEQNDWYGAAVISLCYRFQKADHDKDGVADKNDNCPEIPGKEQFNGCPDTDGDGVEDLVDECPLEPGDALLFGCPDADGDGITDKNDLCPLEAGLPLRRGCPFKDTDGDGIDDLDDHCPLVAGTENLNGCPEIDTDGDGILDDDDKCPKDFGISIFKGCPDTDGDGVEDAKDHCPEEFGLYKNKGCPVITDVKEQAEKLNAQPIYFDTGKYAPLSYTNLDEVAVFLKENTSYKLRLNGYSDSGGSRDQNKYVSRKRAKNCFYYLQKKGIATSRMTYHGYGEEQPVANNKTSEGRRQNRRVEIELYE